MIEENDKDMPLPEFKDYNITEEEALKKTYEFLDLIDFKEICGSDAKIKIRDLQNQIEHKALFEHDFLDFMIKNDNVFEGCVFNWMSEEEFAEYLQKRYHKEEMKYFEQEIIIREIKFN